MTQHQQNIEPRFSTEPSTSSTSCPHWQNLSFSNLLERFKDSEFQKALSTSNIGCIECDRTLEPTSLWACLHCSEKVYEIVRCGRLNQKHSSKHYERTKDHSLVINLGSRIVWCYICNSEVDHVDLKSDLEEKIPLPQHLKDCLLVDKAKNGDNGDEATKKNTGLKKIRRILFKSIWRSNRFSKFRKYLFS